MVEAKTSKFNKLRDEVDPILMKSWTEEQLKIKTLISEKDTGEWNLIDEDPKCIKYIAGMDISFLKSNPVEACSYLAVFSYPDYEIVYEDHEFVKMVYPYVPGFLAFREAPFLENLIKKLQTNKPELCPQVIFFDGNGILHNNGCGIASHFGVLANIPTLGVSKKFFCVDGLTSDIVKDRFAQELAKGNDRYYLTGDSGRIWGAALRSNETTKDPIFVSVGHKISIETAIDLVLLSCLYRVPEPIRQSDLRSRALIRKYEKTI